MTGRFDREYYRQFYLDPRTAVISRAEMRERAGLIAAYARHIGLPVRSILDAGCGIGLLRAPLRRAFPRAAWTGLEYSEYLCQRYGWTQGSLATFRAEPFDLVVCYDVLQYLDDRTAVRALANLGRLCQGALYFSVLTAGDWRRNADRSRTDGDGVRLRPASWYKSRLARQFRPLGGGLLARRGYDPLLWELEKPWS